MLLLKSEKKFLHFNLHDSEDVDAYNKILSNPAIKIIEKRFEKQETSQFNEDYNTKESSSHVYLEVEECRL
jgi:hypothetical protein